MRRVVVVGVDDVAGGAAAGAIVAGVIVGAGEGHDGIEEAGFLQAEEDGVGAELGAEAALGELIVGLAGLFDARGITEFALFVAAAFEDAQYVAGLGDFPAFERIELREDSVFARFFG